MAAGRSLTIADLIQQRQTARQHRDFVKADQIRDRLAAVRITVVDQRSFLRGGQGDRTKPMAGAEALYGFKDELGRQLPLLLQLLE
jgi:excinuclease UvrABC nuclease subunit